MDDEGHMSWPIGVDNPERAMRYKILGRLTGLRVSELALGTGMFGTKWGHGADRDESRRLFDGYLEAGGNFLDTSDSYQFGESESLLGEFIKARRSVLVVATKYAQSADPRGSLSVTGNSRKAMVCSLEASLKRLGTDRIDLYWVHMPDGVTPIEEIVRGLDDLVRSGKVLYIGLSDFPAWRTSAAAMLAELRGWTPIAAQQIEYSLVQRTPERELLPMAAAFGLATIAWSPLGGGVLTGVHSSHGCGLIRSESLAGHFGSRLRSLAECDGGPRSDHARFLLPLTERLNVCHHALGRREGFARTNLRLRHGLRAATWQQNQNEAKPECRSQKEPHTTPLFPGCFPSALQKTSVEIARELLCVHGEVAVGVAGSESPSETHTLESYCDWRLTKR